MKADREQAERVADPDSLSESERAELKRLRKENAQLDASRDSVEGVGIRWVSPRRAPHPSRWPRPARRPRPRRHVPVGGS